VNFNAESETLTTDATTDVTTTYYEQSSGMITDGAGAQLYVDSADEFTFEATTEGTANADPLKTLDDALAKVDTLRSDLSLPSPTYRLTKLTSLLPVHVSKMLTTQLK
tara:strand:- start:930 stop:1253 length:324 start_codon:yes stop_codon:yes gene_type:complete